jgi:hypothetical protein
MWSGKRSRDWTMKSGCWVGAMWLRLVLSRVSCWRLSMDAMVKNADFIALIVRCDNFPTN